MKQLLPLLIGFVLGEAAVGGVIAVAANRTPAVPQLRPPTAIQVTLYPGDWVGGIDGVPVDIPPDKLDLAFRLLTPDTHFGDGVHEFVTPVVAEAVVTHADGARTRVLVRDYGHNPAVVTVDGRNYFYARNDADIVAGAVQLVRLVKEVKFRKKGPRQPEP